MWNCQPATPQERPIAIEIEKGPEVRNGRNIVVVAVVLLRGFPRGPLKVMAMEIEWEFEFKAALESRSQETGAHYKRWLDLVWREKATRDTVEKNAERRNGSPELLPPPWLSG